MKLQNVKIGMRVEAGDGDDHDAGRVLDLNPESAIGHEVLVGWDQGIQTWIEASELTEES